MSRKRKKIDKPFSPEKYGMAYCPYCRGTGRSPIGEESLKVCTQCGGFGWVKKEEDRARQ